MCRNTEVSQCSPLLLQAGRRSSEAEAKDDLMSIKAIDLPTRFQGSKVDLMRAALGLVDRGFFIFPCLPRDKKPRGGRGFLDATNSADLAGEHWAVHPDDNIGCWPGKSGHVVIDVDGPEGMDEAEKLGVLSVRTTRVTTGKGSHYWFRKLTPDPIGNVDIADHIDVRADRGYVVMPPSVHPLGHLYNLHGRWGEMAPLPEPLHDLLREKTLKMDAPDVIAVPAWVTRVLSPAPMDKDRRIGLYIAKVGHRPQGSRNNAAFRIAAFLVRDMALDDDVAMAYLADWNAGNSPPLRGRELRATLRSAQKNGSRMVGAAFIGGGR